MSYEVKLSQNAQPIGPYLKKTKNSRAGRTKATPHSCRAG